MDIAQNIRRLRELKGLSQSEMAARMDISQKAYSKIENKGNKITMAHIQVIADILEVTVTELYDLDVDRIVNGKGHYGSKRNPVSMANYKGLSNTQELFNELLATKDELINAMREELERLQQKKKMENGG